MKGANTSTLEELREHILIHYGPQALIAKNRKTVAAEYSIHVSTLRRKMKKYCPELNGSDTLLPLDLLLIYSRLGIPPAIKIN